MTHTDVKTFHVASPEAMRDVVDYVCEYIQNAPDKTVFGLSGELGAGKTTFMRLFLQTTSVSQSASSPTFVVRKFYPINEGSTLAPRYTGISHIDAYRLERPEDSRAIGLDNDMSDPHILVFVEWPERVGTLLETAEHYAGTLYFEHVSETERSVRCVFGSPEL